MKSYLLKKVTPDSQLEGKYVYFPYIYGSKESSGYWMCLAYRSSHIAGLCTLSYCDNGVEYLNIVYDGEHAKVPASQVIYEVPASLRGNVKV